VTPVRVMIADDHPIVVRALGELFGTEGDVVVVGTCSTGKEAIEQSLTVKPDVLVLDVKLPDLGGVEVLRRLLHMEFDGRVLLLTAELDDRDALEAVRLGARGIVFKDQAPEDLLSAVRAVHRGDRWLPPHLVERALDAAIRRESARQDLPKELTHREIDVIRLVGRGLSNKRIARDLSIAEGTVKIHLNSVFRKLEVSSRLQVALSARQRGLL
jgi:DNA-binding NarL/FixJ family response regulator